MYGCMYVYTYLHTCMYVCTYAPLYIHIHCTYIYNVYVNSFYLSMSLLLINHRGNY